MASALFARRTGTLPADGAPRVGGVKLPRGSRCLGYWATDLPTAHAHRLARRLSAVFPLTGLWPVLWSGRGDPDQAVMGVTDPRAADGFDVAAHPATS